MAVAAASKARTISIWVLRVILGIAFLAIGATKLSGTGNTVAYFAAIGWGQWLRYLTGSIDIAGAILLFVPRWTCYGAIALIASVGLGTLISLTVLYDDPVWGGWMMTAVPLTFTVLAVMLAWLTSSRRATKVDYD